jgi:hypothetical protein
MSSGNSHPEPRSREEPRDHGLTAAAVLRVRTDDAGHHERARFSRTDVAGCIWGDRTGHRGVRGHVPRRLEFSLGNQLYTLRHGLVVGDYRYPATPPSVATENKQTKLMPGSLAEQERNAVELFARADRLVPDNHSVVRTTPLTRPTHTHADPLALQRKHALSHAIKLAHSSHTSLKRMAAFNIAKFFKAFPELEEDAINAVYDLCEDQDPNVRHTTLRTVPSADSFYCRYESRGTRLSCGCRRSSPDGWSGT